MQTFTFAYRSEPDSRMNSCLRSCFKQKANARIAVSWYLVLVVSLSAPPPVYASYVSKSVLFRNKSNTVRKFSQAKLSHGFNNPTSFRTLYVFFFFFFMLVSYYLKNPHTYLSPSVVTVANNKSSGLPPSSKSSILLELTSRQSFSVLFTRASDKSSK